MNWLQKIFGTGIKEVSEGLDLLFKRFKLDPAVAHEHKRAVLETLVSVFNEMEESVQHEIKAKEAIILAELQQDDKFTKRARPWIVYSGLILAGLEVVARYTAWITGSDLPTVEGAYITTMVPEQFWLGWTGVVSIYSIGRSAEKRGLQNKVVDYITGGKQKRTLFE